jgi:hypothetical protein
MNNSLEVLQDQQSGTWALFIVVHKLLKREIHYAVGKTYIDPHTLTKECYHFVRRIDESVHRSNASNVGPTETIQNT